jgi:CO/xanthine dehydrogenase FAD-binding subunit
MTIKAYYRPKTVQEALDLLPTNREKTIPLGGGTSVSRLKSQDVAVVDLQALGLDSITPLGHVLRAGGTATLHALGSFPGLEEGLRRAVELEANFNIRQRATIAGCIVTGDGRSTLLTALLAMDGLLTWLPGGVEQRIGEFLLTRADSWPGKIIESISLPLSVKFRFTAVGRSPADVPVICVGLTAWPSGRVRIAVGGYGPYPILALDAAETGGAEIAVRDALTHSGDDWASAEYRQEAAAVLVRRMLMEI